jgi:hypothetical protein
MSDHLFGKLRSLLHSHDPSPRVWRRITASLYPAHTARRPDLVPYLDDLLDARWPDHLRVAPQRWIQHIQREGSPYHAWPIARTLRAWAPQDGSHPLLYNGQLANITHIYTEGVPSITNIKHVLNAPALRSLRGFDGSSSSADTPAVHALLTRHPTLQTLTTGYGPPLEALPTPDLPNLHTLDVTRLRLPPAGLAALLTPANLPALRHLRVHTEAPLSDALLSRLSSLLLRGPRLDLDTLAALPRLDHLTVETSLTAETLASLATIPAPRALTLSNLHDAPSGPAPERWRVLDGLQELTAYRIHTGVPLLQTLLRSAARASLTHLHLHSSHTPASLAPLLLEAPWPHLTHLRVERCNLQHFGADPALLARAFPSLRHLTVRCGNAFTDVDIDAIFAAPWFPQLETLDLNSSYYAASQRDAHPVISAVHNHQNLTHLGLCSSSVNPQHVAQLGHTHLPNLKILRLGKVVSLKTDEIDALCNARWLKQLQYLRLSASGDRADGWRYNAPKRRLTNLKALLRRAGLPDTARVSY